MFTGIIRAIGRARWLDESLLRVVVESSEFGVGLMEGASIACAGVCLTAIRVAVEGERVTFEANVSGHTRRMTNLARDDDGEWSLNVERSLRAGDEIGGHYVSGHVMGTARVVAFEQLPLDCRRLVVHYERLNSGGGSPVVQAQDSVAIDGVSLTVAERIDACTFALVLVPYTLASTTLAELCVDARVNVEWMAARATKSDREWMADALACGELGRTTTAPNPWVGCIVVAYGRELARGYHERAGGPHAEVVALRKVSNPCGATLYVTLEPCAHTGRTGPCVEALIEARVARVVVGVEDADERVRGRGLARLREAGIAVTLLNDERVARSLEPYTWHRRLARPYVVAKVALTIDGSIGYKSGDSRWITDEAARKHVRSVAWAQSQAIIFGARTLAVDDPADLDECPFVVILGCPRNGALRVWSHRRVLIGDHRGGGGADCQCPATAERIDARTFDTLLAALYSRGVIQVLIEGGSITHARALAANAVDALWLYQGAALAGAHGRRWLDELTYGASMGGIGRLELLDVERVGVATTLTRFRVRRTPSEALLAAERALRAGSLACLVDGESRENEGDLVGAARHFSVEQSTLFRRLTTNMVCTPMSAEHARQLELAPMVPLNEDRLQTPFAVSCDAAALPNGSGVSAADRVATVRTLASSSASGAELCRPGHVFPLIARRDLRDRQGHTEASVALCVRAGIEPPVAVIAELQDDCGAMTSPQRCAELARERDIPLVAVDELVALTPPRLLECRRLAEAPLELASGRQWRLLVYSSTHALHTQHKVLVFGQLRPDDVTLTRVHSECFTGDVLGSRHCDCGEQLQTALALIVERGAGVCIVVGGHEGRGIGLVDKVRAYALQRANPSLDTFSANEQLGFAADARSYDDVTAILDDLRVARIELLTNNDDKRAALDRRVALTTPLTIVPNPTNARYLAAKARKQPIPHFTLPARADPTRPLRIAVVCALWRGELLDSLLGVLVAALERGGGGVLVETIRCPGAFEVAYFVKARAHQSSADAVVALALLLKGETDHHRIITDAITPTLLNAPTSAHATVPIVNGVLTCDTLAQARARCCSVELATSLAETALFMATAYHNSSVN